MEIVKYEVRKAERGFNVCSFWTGQDEGCVVKRFKSKRKAVAFATNLQFQLELGLISKTENFQ